MYITALMIPTFWNHFDRDHCLPVPLGIDVGEKGLRQTPAPGVLEGRAVLFLFPAVHPHLFLLKNRRGYHLGSKNSRTLAV